MPDAADLLLHPIRLRVIQALAGGRRMSPAELGEALGDVPQASLYRHIRRLAEAGVLVVVDERPARGTPQRVYALAEGAGSLAQEDVDGATTNDHLRWFTVFLAGLLDDFGRYVRGGAPDFAADGAGYRQVPLELTDEELADLTQRMGEVIAPYLSREPGPGRRRRMLTTILLPVEPARQGA